MEDILFSSHVTCFSCCVQLYITLLVENVTLFRSEISVVVNVMFQSDLNSTYVTIYFIFFTMHLPAAVAISFVEIVYIGVFSDFVCLSTLG